MTIYYSVLFSLEEPKKNLYSYLPFFQYKALQQTGNLKAGDAYVVICDPDTALFLRRAPTLQGIKILVAPKPRSLLEGMAIKYILPGLIDIKGQTVVYLDLDILPLGPIDFHVPEDSLLVYPEGAATDSNYCGNKRLPLAAGCSAGFFAYRDGPRVKAFFTSILQAMSNSQEKFYTLDQPHFNHALVGRDFAVAMPHSVVSFNGHTNRDTARLVNLCGDPGDGPLHFQKVVEFFLSTFLRSH